MTRRLMVFFLAVLVGLPSAVLAHGGHVHKVMGTVSAVQNGRVEVTAQDGAKVSVVLNDKTVYRQGRARADVKALTVGRRVVIDALQDEKTKVMTAQTVQVAAPPQAAQR